ncbi:MAG: hypothetical protein BWY32_01431 [bacterium ADurb.Bin243]|nr:MAG: hypothetical protein BWY32_01431 [bacterium ADurb.Bin243]
MSNQSATARAMMLKRFNRTIELVKKYKSKIPEFVFDSLIAPKPDPSFDDFNTLIYKLQQIDESENRNPNNVINELFNPEIADLKAKKFVVWQLQKAVKEKGLAEIMEEFDRFYNGFEMLKVLKDRLEKIQIDHLHPRFKEILNKIARKDCMRVAETEEEIKDLEIMVRTGEIFLFYSDGKAKDEWGNPERSDFKPIADMAKQMFMKKIKEDFSSKGYVTKKLEKVLTGDIRNVGRAFWGFEKMVAKVDKLEARLKRHSKSMKPEDAAAFEKMLKDPDCYYDAVTKMGQLEAKLDPTGDSTLLAYYKRMIENYKKQELATGELEKMLSKPLGEAAKLFETYDDNFRKYYRIANYMEKNRAFYFDEKKIESINQKLKNPMLRYELEAEIVSYEKEAIEFAFKCEQSIAKMEELGYDVPFLYELVENYANTMQQIKAGFSVYASRIKKLIHIREKAIPRLRAFNNKEIEFQIDNISDFAYQIDKLPGTIEQLIKAEEQAKPGDPENFLGYQKRRMEFLKAKGMAADSIIRLTNFNLYGYSDFINACELIEFKKGSQELAMLLKILGITIIPPEVMSIINGGSSEALAAFK